MPLADAPPQPPINLAVPVLVQVTAERVWVGPQQQMGLAGLHYLRPLGDVARDAAPATAGAQAYGGVSVFGATHGGPNTSNCGATMATRPGWVWPR